MTLAAFDPRNITQYKKPPYLLHFQWSSGENIYRYALVDIIPPQKINSLTKQKEDEQDMSQKQIWEAKYK